MLTQMRMYRWVCMWFICWWKAKRIYTTSCMSKIVIHGLFEWLLDRGIYACGMVRKGRVGFPRRGRFKHCMTSYLSFGDLLAQSWFDSKEVYFLSTIHSGEYPADRPIANRTIRHRSAAGPIDVPAPPLLHNYNHYMGGVDLADNILQHYSIGRKTFRAYRRILYHGVELCVHNAYTVECLVERPGQAGTLGCGALAFRMELAKLLVSQHQAMGPIMFQIDYVMLQ